MQNFFVMNVFKSEANLRKPVQNFIFVKKLQFSLGRSQFILVFDLCLQITSITIVHNNAELSFFCLVNFSETCDIRMVEDFENLSFSECLLAFFLTHLSDVYLLDDS